MLELADTSTSDPYDDEPRSRAETPWRRGPRSARAQDPNLAA
jgi:hypothetical protein